MKIICVYNLWHYTLLFYVILYMCSTKFIHGMISAWYSSQSLCASYMSTCKQLGKGVTSVPRDLKMLETYGNNGAGWRMLESCWLLFFQLGQNIAL